MTRRLAPLVAALVLPVLLVAGAFAPAAAAASPPPAVRYVDLLRSALDRLPAQPSASPDDPGVTAALASLDEAAGVQPDQSGPLAPIRADLRRTPADVDDARARLGAATAVLRLPQGATGGSDGSAAKRQLDAVYARPDFRSLDRPDAGSGPLDGIRGAISRVIDALGPVATILIGTALGVVLVLVAGLLLRRTMAPRAATAAEPLEPSGTDPDAEWRAAGRAAADGDHREAVRRAFRAALLAAAARTGLGVDASWTNRELLARLAGDANLVAALAPAAASFEIAWYSGREVTEADWELARTRCAAVRGLAAGGPAPAGTTAR